MIYLRNEGLIDLDVIKTMGVNVKECEGAIGMFGTGLKYAIAVFLREGVDMTMYRGKDEYSFYTETKTIRGKQFNVCLMAGPYDSVELGFTDQLGANWELWQAYREMHSNCLDEGGEFGGKLNPEDNHTTFKINMQIDPADIFVDLQDKKMLFKNDDIEIMQGASDCIYYKGIKAKLLKDDSIYTYNVLRYCDLTEDRLLCYDHQVSELISHTVSKLEGDKKDIIKNVVTAIEGTYENGIKPCSYFAPSPGEAFKEVIESAPKTNHGFAEYHDKHKPKVPKTDAQKKREFLISLKEQCSELDIDYQDSETNALVITLSGGVLSCDEGDAL